MYGCLNKNKIFKYLNCLKITVSVISCTEYWLSDTYLLENEYTHDGIEI